MRNNDALEYAQKLEIENSVTLFSIFTNSGQVLNLTNTSNSSGIEDVRLGDTVFSSLPISMDDTSFSSTGAGSRPSLSIANISGAFSDTDFTEQNEFDDIIGATVIIRTTFKKFIDKFNVEYPNGNTIDLENNLSIVRKDKYIIDRISSKNIIQITFELASVFDLHNVQVPSKTITGGFCPFIYKGASQEFLDVNGYNTGACTWDNFSENVVITNDEQSTSLVSRAIFMTASNEYIVQYNENTFEVVNLPSISDEVPGVQIEKDHYYFKISPSKGIEVMPNGGTRRVDVYDYWQATQDISEAFEEFHQPSDTSRFWRRIRVFDTYTPSTTYRGYTDKTRNEYVAVLQAVEEAPDVETQFSTSDTVTRTENGETFTLRRSLLTGRFTQDQIDSLIVYTPFGVQLKKHFPNLLRKSYGLTNSNEYSIVTEEGGKQFFYSLSTYNTHIISADLNSSGIYYKLFQINSSTQTGGAHITTPTPNIIWKEGDVCGKNLTACALRFQALPVTPDDSEAILIEELEEVQVNIATDINNTTHTVDIGTAAWSSLNEYGRVTPTMNLEQFSLFEMAYEGVEGYSDGYNTGAVLDFYDNHDQNGAQVAYMNVTLNGPLRLEAKNSDNSSTLELEKTVIGKLHATVPWYDHPEITAPYGGYIESGKEYPIPNGIEQRYSAMLIETSFAYQKVNDGQNKHIKLYYLGSPNLTATEAPKNVVDSGNLVEFDEVGGDIQIRQLQPFDPWYTTYNGGPPDQVAAGTFLFNVPNTMNFNFKSFDDQSGTGAIDQYITTDRQTSTSIPFGGFPGTKRFS